MGEYTPEDMRWAIQNGRESFEREELPYVVETQLRRATYGMDTEAALSLIGVIEDEAGTEFSSLCNEYRRRARDDEHNWHKPVHSKD
jgi:hypothetical protein